MAGRDKDNYNRWMREWRKKHAEHHKEWRKENYKNNKETVNARCRANYAASAEARREYARQYRKTHLPEINAYMANRRALKLNATPKWANLDLIKEVYLNCPEGYHVDHIIPLKNKLVCGLHVENNLQYLPAVENIKKGNKIPMEYTI